jgi:hypothetical protein
MKFHTAHHYICSHTKLCHSGFVWLWSVCLLSLVNRWHISRTVYNDNNLCWTTTNSSQINWLPPVSYSGPELSHAEMQSHSLSRLKTKLSLSGNTHASTGTWQSVGQRFYPLFWPGTCEATKCCVAYTLHSAHSSLWRKYYFYWKHGHVAEQWHLYSYLAWYIWN